MIITVHLRNQPLKWGYLFPEIVEVLNQAATWSHRSGKDVWLTSVNDHQHGPNSLHGRNLAVDFDLPDEEDLHDLYLFLRANLDRKYDVVWEENHIHVELEVAK